MSVRANLRFRAGSRSGDFSVKAATLWDAQPVFDLKRSALGSRYLKYTIYQAAESVHEIRKIVRHLEPGNEIFIVKEAGRLAGYYHAVLSGREYQLNYIAVQPEMRSQGVGAILLRHFQSRAVHHGCTHTSLDVFASNPRARAWYAKEHYRMESQSWVCRFTASGDAPPSECSVECSRQTVRQALATEKQFGFSRMGCRCDGREIEIGLIAGHTCRLLHPGSAVEPLAAAALAWTKSQGRQTLISWWPALPPTEWPLASSELSIRMVRPVDLEHK